MATGMAIKTTKPIMITARGKGRLGPRGGLGALESYDGGIPVEKPQVCGKEAWLGW